MDSTKLLLFVLIIFTNVTFQANASQIKFEAYPRVLKANLTSAVSMRCDLNNNNNKVARRTVQNTTDDVLHVTSIIITYKDGQVVAQGTPFEAPMALVDIGNLDVKGDVSGTSSEGYLELSWATPALMSLGEYVCEIHTLDSMHKVTVFRTSLSIAREEPSLNDIVAMLQTQQHTIQGQQQMINNLQRDNTKIYQNMTILQQTNIQVQQNTTILQQENAMLKSKLENCSAVVGFSSGITSSNTISSGETVIYTTVITNEGNGYDKSTGIFTCTTPGLYLFGVHGLSSNSGTVHLSLNHNNNEVAGLYGHYSSGHDYYESASLSSVIHLKAGDQVQVKSRGSSDLYNSYKSNLFTGILVRADGCQAKFSKNDKV